MPRQKGCSSIGSSGGGIIKYHRWATGEFGSFWRAEVLGKPALVLKPSGSGLNITVTSTSSARPLTMRGIL